MDHMTCGQTNQGDSIRGLTAYLTARWADIQSMWGKEDATSKNARGGGGRFLAQSGPGAGARRLQSAAAFLPRKLYCKTKMQT